MTLGLYPDETQQGYDAAAMMGVAPAEAAPITAGLGSAIVQGPVGGAQSVYQTAKTGLVTFGAEMARETGLTSAAQRYGLDPSAPLSSLILDPDRAEHQQAVDSQQAVADAMPNPQKTGVAGRTLAQIESGLTQFLGGTLVGGPAAGAAVVGVTQGTMFNEQLAVAGVDETTRHEIAIPTGIASGLASLLPGGFGPTLTSRAVSGAAAQLGIGLAERGMSHVVLDNAGYHDMAQQYRVLDGQDMIADAVLGAAFGGVHHIFAPSVADAAFATKDAVRVENVPGDSVPIDPASRQNNVDNQRGTMDALLNDKPPPDLKPVESVPNPERQAAGAETARGVSDAVDELVPGRVEAPREPEATIVKQAIKESTPTEPLAQEIKTPEQVGFDVSGLDPETRDAVESAQREIDNMKDFQVPDINGKMVDGRDVFRKMVQDSLNDIKNGDNEAELHRIATICGARA